MKSASFQGDIVITGDFFLFYTNLGGEGRGERSIERGNGVEKGVIRA